jgi:ABC-type transport system substrate-binding protein
MNPKATSFRPFVILLICSVLLAACQPANSAASEAVSTDTAQAPAATQANDADAISKNILLDAALASDADSLKINQYLYEGLVRLDSSGKAEPALAESWVISDDQLDYIFKLRANAAFSDGTPITPDIVAANFNRWFDPQNPLHGTGDYAAWQKNFLGFHGEKDPDQRAKSTVDGIQKVDVNTVLIHLNRPVPELLTALADPAFAILSIDALTKGGYGKSGSTIISSGPYIVSSWTDAGLTLSPNPNYWDTKPQGDLKFTWK